MKNKPLIIAISIIVVVIGGFVVAGLMNQSDKMTETGTHNSSDMPARQSETNTNETAQESNAVTIENYAFNPANITVKKGTTVTWTNNDAAEHNVEFDEEPATGDKEGPLLSKGETYSFTFDTVGTFGYICSPHPYMKGTVTVVE